MKFLARNPDLHQTGGLKGELPSLRNFLTDLSHQEWAIVKERDE
jgi:hypothetical protein